MRHGAGIDPPNRFEKVHCEPAAEHLEWDQEHLQQPNRPIEYQADESQSIVSENDSPDISFRYSINPYRGCAHGCAYCYARPSHEYLGFSAGLDFETKIIFKPQAARLFREFLARDRWTPEEVVFSGVTDCYQPAEREFRLTRACLEVARVSSLPIGIVTKNALVVRDLDVLGPMAARNLVRVSISITTLDHKLARNLEPRTSIPAARLRAIRELTAAGIPTQVLVAPIIPGLNDREIPAILEQARAAGALRASYSLLRLPLSVEPVFREWLHRVLPGKAALIENRVQTMRSGRWNQSDFGTRMTGSGELADQLAQMFSVFARKHGLEGRLPPPDFSQFRPPPSKTGQLRLF